MSATALLALTLALLQSILAAAKVGGAPADVIALLQSAVDSLLKVQGTDVTYSQLEALRVKTEW